MFRVSEVHVFQTVLWEADISYNVYCRQFPHSNAALHRKLQGREMCTEGTSTHVKEKTQLAEVRFLDHI